MLNFNGAVGYLVGEPHRGIVYMFHMMNEARLGVGMGAVALGYTGYLKSLQYALERPQGRPITSKDPGTPQVPIVEHADIRRMLLAQKSYAEGSLALALYCARLVDWQHSAESDQERDEATLLLDILTPIAKSWPSQWCVEANSLAIQVLGGYGYTRSTTSNSTTGTTGSTPSMKAPTASRAWICWAARSLREGCQPDGTRRSHRPVGRGGQARRRGGRRPR